MSSVETVGGQDSERALDRATVLALVAMGARRCSILANDFTALNVALPAIEKDFDADVGDRRSG